MWKQFHGAFKFYRIKKIMSRQLENTLVGASEVLTVRCGGAAFPLASHLMAFPVLELVAARVLLQVEYFKVFIG